jgi:hypothetical protein
MRAGPDAVKTLDWQGWSFMAKPIYRNSAQRNGRLRTDHSQRRFGGSTFLQSHMNTQSDEHRAARTPHQALRVV